MGEVISIVQFSTGSDSIQAKNSSYLSRKKKKLYHFGKQKEEIFQNLKQILTKILRIPTNSKEIKYINWLHLNHIQIIINWSKELSFSLYGQASGNHSTDSRMIKKKKKDI